MADVTREWEKVERRERKFETMRKLRNFTKKATEKNRKGKTIYRD